MDRHENPGINPGNGPATWEHGKKAMHARQVDDTVPQAFTSAIPGDRLEEAEGGVSPSEPETPQASAQ
jgi:hypothetical protein